MKIRKRKWLIAAAALFCLSASAAGALLFNGVIRFNNPPMRMYPVRGVDVSSYQGAVDWDVLSGQGIGFAYIRATEGSSTQDARFSFNWEHACKTGLTVGAYHYFSFDSSADAQADNFIRTVPVRSDALPPAVDLELYGNKRLHPPAKPETDKLLSELLRRLEEHYGKKPVIYVTQRTYDLYISGGYADYAVWIRDVITKPSLPDKKLWTFWQYTDRQKLPGYKGSERFIDMNVFRGTKAEFDRLCR